MNAFSELFMNKKVSFRVYYTLCITLPVREGLSLCSDVFEGTGHGSGERYLRGKAKEIR